MPSRIEFVSQTGSTNADLLARLCGGDPIAEGGWLVADRQLAGRGRHGRSWLDGPGNFMGSTMVCLTPADPAPSSLSFVAALAVYETLVARLGEGHRLRLKWPNDLQLDGAKFAGILLEREGANVVVGIGVNLAAAPAISDRAVGSLSRLGPAPDRDGFAHSLARSFAAELENWRAHGAEPVFARWLAAAHKPGTPLLVHDEGGTRVAGTFAGIAPDGALRLRLADGATRVIHAGDVEVGAG